MDTKELLETFIQVEINNTDEFLKVKETLTRVGISNRKEKRLYQTCHILHKQSLYYIVHFKELFALDGRMTDIDEEDFVRRNTIASLLEQWGLLKILNPQVMSIVGNRNSLFILPHREKNQWTLSPKYAIGKKQKEKSNVVLPQ